MDVPKLKMDLLKYVASHNPPNVLHDWDTTAKNLGWEKAELFYVVNEMELYFLPNKSGFFAKNKAIIEGKHNIAPTPIHQLNMMDIALINAARTEELRAAGLIGEKVITSKPETNTSSTPEQATVNMHFNAPIYGNPTGIQHNKSADTGDEELGLSKKSLLWTRIGVISTTIIGIAGIAIPIILSQSVRDFLKRLFGIH
ncbi:MAG TPA: hypothetical protein VG842_06365 [Sediminibacterium sp.]|nr:hypothetical protein [Sediminibacterium sp.]